MKVMSLYIVIVMHTCCNESHNINLINNSAQIVLRIGSGVCHTEYYTFSTTSRESVSLQRMVKVCDEFIVLDRY